MIVPDMKEIEAESEIKWDVVRQKVLWVAQ